MADQSVMAPCEASRFDVLAIIPRTQLGLDCRFAVGAASENESAAARWQASHLTGTEYRAARYEMLHISLTTGIRYVTWRLRGWEAAMMPVIRINDATFADLSALKTWFGTKTPSDTIDRIVREAMEGLGIERDHEPEEAVKITNEGAMEFSTAPGLLFTKPLTATINGRRMLNPRWSSLLIATITEVMNKGYEGKKLVGELQVPAKAERYEDEGYKFYPDLGISVQGQSSTDAWKEIDRLAKAHGIVVTVEFWWRRNSKAQFPGKTGILRSARL